MSPADEVIKQLITGCLLLANALSADEQDDRAADVYNAMLSLRRAYSLEYQAELDRKDLERLEALRSA